MPPVIRILSENPLEQLWLHLSKWESQTLAHKLIVERAQREGRSLAPGLAEAKAQGLAYCLRNAREYLRGPESSFNKRLLNGYYGLMALIGAVLIADPATKYDLPRFEEATKMGHGLNNIDDPTEAFPDAQKVFVTEDGLLVRYLRSVGIDTTDLKLTGRIRTTKDLQGEQRERLLSLDSLLAGVPELHEIYHEVTGRPPLSVELHWASDLNPDPDGLAGAYLKARGELGSSDPYPGGVWLSTGYPGVLTEELAREHLRLPFSRYQSYTDEVTDKTSLAGFLECPENEPWTQHIPLYRSVMTADSFSRPLLGKIFDPLVRHYLLMYALSIIVRYRPSVWREVSEGRHDASLALLTYYHEAFTRVVPQIALERVAGAEVMTMQPGTWNAPV